MSGMHTYFFFITGLIELTILLNVVMITDAFAMETRIVTGTKHINGKTLIAAGRRTMNHYKRNLPRHSFTFLEPVGSTALDGHGAEDTSDHGCDEF